MQICVLFFYEKPTYLNFSIKKICRIQIFNVPLHPHFAKARAFSSVGLEHLPYKQRVGGSNPSTPTRREGGSLL